MDYINLTKIEIVKNLTEIEIEIRQLHSKINRFECSMLVSSMLETVEYKELFRLRRDRNKLNEILNLMEDFNV